MPFRDLWLVVGFILFVAGFAASQPPIAAVGATTVVLGWVSRYWSRHLSDRVTLRRQPAETRVFSGEKVALHIELSNRKPLPLPWYEWRLSFSEQLPVEGEPLLAAAQRRSLAKVQLPIRTRCSSTGTV